jgi:hypothetical protein
MLNKGFEGVSGVMADVNEGSDEDDSDQDQKNHDDDDSSESDSSDSANSDHKYVPIAPTKNSEEKQGFEAVSGSGEVPVYTEEVANQDQNAVFKGNFSTDIFNSNDEDAAADSNSKTKYGIKVDTNSDNAPIDTEVVENQKDQGKEKDEHDHKHQDDRSNDKNAAAASMSSSKTKNEIEAVSGSGEVPVYTKEIANNTNQDQNTVFTGNYFNCTDSLNTNDENAAASPNSITKHGIKVVTESGNSLIDTEVDGNQKNQGKEKNQQDQKHQDNPSNDDSKSSDRGNSNDKSAAAAPMSNSKAKYALEAVSGSGEVPVYYDKAGNRLCKCRG